LCATLEFGDTADIFVCGDGVGCDITPEPTPLTLPVPSPPATAPPFPAKEASAAAALFFRPRRQKNSTPTIKSPIAATPPTAPPTMAPMLLFDPVLPLVAALLDADPLLDVLELPEVVDELAPGTGPNGSLVAAAAPGENR
jgi:hypothetical protein